MHYTKTYKKCSEFIEYTFMSTPQIGQQRHVKNMLKTDELKFDPLGVVYQRLVLSYTIIEFDLFSCIYNTIHMIPLHSKASLPTSRNILEQSPTQCRTEWKQKILSPQGLKDHWKA
jgi:hypothetical protein